MLDTSTTPLPSPNNPPQAENQSLGIIAKIASQPTSSGRKRRYQLQDYAAKLLSHVMVLDDDGNPTDKHKYRVHECCRKPLPGAAVVQVMHSPECKTSYLRQTVTCNRLWECPVCAEKITNQRREELAAAISAARRLGWRPVLVTATLRHDKSFKLLETLAALLEAWRDFTSGKGFQELKEQWYWEGSIKSLEPTYGVNGWHPHLHFILFLSGNPKSFNEGGFRDAVSDRWRQVLARQGYDASDEHGIDVRAADEDIAEYVAKFGREPKDAGWTASAEMVKGGTKRGRIEGLTPFQLLEIYGKGDDSEEAMAASGVVANSKQAGALFSEYVAAFHGRKQLVWSRGLREALALAPELSDAEVCEQEPPDAVEMAAIEVKAWKRIVAAGKRGELLEVAASGDAIMLRAWLWKNFGIMHIDLMELSDGN